MDEPAADILVRNAEAVVAVQTATQVKDGKVVGGNGAVKEFLSLVDPGVVPTDAQLEAAVQYQLRVAIGRSASREDVGRFLALYRKGADAGDRPGAARAMLAAVLLRTDAVYRSKVGAGSGARRMPKDFTFTPESTFNFAPSPFTHLRNTLTYPRRMNP